MGAGQQQQASPLEVGRERARRYGQVVAKAWTDESFKQRLLADPAAVLREHGVDVPDGAQVHVHESTDTVIHLPLPAKPSGELSDEELEAIAGGTTPPPAAVGM